MAKIKKSEVTNTEVKETKKAKKTAEKAVVKSTVASSSPTKKVTNEQKIATGLSVDVVDTAGKVTGSISLPKSIFGAKINTQLISQAIRVYLVNHRQGTVSTKTRGEVEGSTRKIYRQKGTGRARHGGIRAPIFVKGGIAHGPKQKEYELSMPKKMKRAALFSVLSAKAKDGEIKIVTGLEALEAKTKVFAGVLDTWEHAQKKRSILIVLPNDIEAIYRSVRNLTGVAVTTVQRLNAYEVLRHKVVIVMKDAVESIEKTFTKKEEK